MPIHASLLLAGLLCSFSSYGQHEHSHQKDTSYHIRDHWGDFTAGEKIKMKEISWVGTPVERVIAKKGKLKEEYSYVDSIDIYQMVYESDGLMVSGFVVKPKAAGTYPCIIYNRGGNRDLGQLVVGTAVQYLGLIASNGYIVIASNYRGNGGSEGDEEFGGADIHDVLNLPEALAQIEGADTSRIGMLGMSRGGMMSYKALREDFRFDALAVIGGMADMATSVRFRPEMETHVFAELIPNYTLKKDSIHADRSVTFWFDESPKSCPLLILHGTDDDKVSVEEARLLHAALDENEHPHQYLEFYRENHGISGHHEEVFQAIIAHFDRYVKEKYPRNPAPCILFIAD